MLGLLRQQLSDLLLPSKKPIISRAGLPNALTGATITIASSGLPVFLYYFGWLTALDERWLMVFLAQTVVYVLVYFQLVRLTKS